VNAADYLGTVVGVPQNRRRRPDLSILRPETAPQDDNETAAAAIEVITPEDPAELWVQTTDDFQAASPPQSPAAIGPVRIAVSPAGALPRRALTELLVAGARPRMKISVLVGFEYGCAHGTLGADGAVGHPRTLHPGAAHYHVRLGRPWQLVDTCEALAAVRISIQGAARMSGLSRQRGMSA
jgi:hypothetical protein